jgi:hypothetical protein
MSTHESDYRLKLADKAEVVLLCGLAATCVASTLGGLLSLPEAGTHSREADGGVKDLSATNEFMTNEFIKSEFQDPRTRAVFTSTAGIITARHVKVQPLR